MNKLQIKLLSENATMPTRANATDAGYDIYAAETITLKPQDKTLVATDIAVNIPQGYVGLLTSRSGISSKTYLVIETGKIDAGYQGHMKVNIKNDFQFAGSNYMQDFVLDINNKKIATHRNDIQLGTYKIKKGDKLAQLVIVPIWTPELEEVTEFDTQSTRGTNGFGSTGC